MRPAPWWPMAAPPLPCEAYSELDWYEQECFRASGEVECSVCGMPYRKHVRPAAEECPSLVRVCDGSLLKL